MSVFDFFGDLVGGVTDLALDIVSPITDVFGFDLREGLNSFGKQISGQNAMQMNRENIAMQRETNEMQKTLHLQDLAFAREQNEKNNQFAAEQAALAFQREAQFNSETARMQRLVNAGINPFVASQQVTGASANATGYSASPSQSPIPVTPSLQAPRNDISASSSAGLQNLLAVFKMGTDLINSLSSSKKNSAEADNIRAQMEEVVNLLRNQNKESSIRQETSKLELSILKATGLEKAKNELKLQVHDIANLAARTNYIALEGDQTKAMTDLIELKKSTQFLQNQLTSEQLKTAPRYFRALVGELESKIRNLDSSTNLNVAQAKTEEVTRGAKLKLLNAQAYEAITQGNVNKEQATTIREMRPVQKKWQELLNDGKVAENKYLEKKCANEVALQIKELERAGMINAQEAERLEILKKENQLKYCKEAVGMLTDIADSAAKFMPYRFPFLSETKGQYSSESYSWSDVQHYNNYDGSRKNQK